MKIARTGAQWRLRYLLACAGAASGGVWGAVSLSVAHNPQMPAVLGGGDIATLLGADRTGQADAGHTALILLLLAAVPLGALVGARPLDLLSHAIGRRPATLASACLLVLGCLVGAVVGGWGQVVAAATAGLGIGGHAIVSPKLAHELAERGHKRLMPRLAAVGPLGAGASLLVGELGFLALPNQVMTCAWLVPLLASLATILLTISLPETPHWYVAQGKFEAGYASLRRMSDAQEAAIAIDWVVMDAGMLGEQRPLSGADLRVERVRRTIVAGLILEAIQMLPFGLAAICLTPSLVGMVAYPVAGQVGAPLWAIATLCVAWMIVALLSLKRRPEHMLLAWSMAGIGVAAIALTALVFLPHVSAMMQQLLLVLVAIMLVAAQYLCVAPACTGGTDPLVPPWLLRSQRRAEAASRPVVQLLSVLGIAGALVAGVPAGVLVSVCLGVEVAGLIFVVLALPKLSAALR